MKVWNELWKDFGARAAGRLPRNAIDQTIDWQLNGVTPFVAEPIPGPHLHLPELYSGSPWNHRERWIAFVTVNPSIDHTEIFPRLSDLETHGVPDTVSFFNDRFEPGPINLPMTHGRQGGNPAKWTNPRNNPRPHAQPTWAAIDTAVRACLAPADRGAEEAPLGRLAMITDVVPWKFAKWSKVPQQQKLDLLNLGAPYLAATLQEHTPAVIVAAGQNVRLLMQDLYPDTVPLYVPNAVQNGAVTVGEHSVPWFGIAAPTAHGRRFRDEMAEIAQAIAAAIA